MKFFLYSLLVALTANQVSAQNTVKNYFPVEIKTVNLSIQRQREIQRQNYLLGLNTRTQKEENELSELLNKYGEVVESAWDIIEGGCSWYCGGGNFSIRASSFLSSTSKETKYASKNANDLSYKTAWVEGKADAGIGEYLEYSFKNASPRITKVIISNGYVKSESAWRNNNRIKRLNMYVNGKKHGVLNLQDSRTDQIFAVGTLGHNRDKTDLVLRFEIAEIYKGNMNNDTAITEIYFDGIDVH
jgi:hypothetical protein